MIKLYIIEGQVTSTFKFASKDELIRTMSNIIRGMTSKNPVVFSIEQNDNTETINAG